MAYPPRDGLRDRIRCKKITVRQLEKLPSAPCGAAGPGSVVPISRIRALAHSRNPCAAPDDIALIVACLGSDCLGYYGLLPGYLLHNNRFRKVYWSSTFYVAEHARGMGIGQELVRSVIALDRDILVCGVSPRARPILRISGYREIEVKTHCQLRLDRLITRPPVSGRQNGTSGSEPDMVVESQEQLNHDSSYRDGKELLYERTMAEIPRHAGNIECTMVDRLEALPESGEKGQPRFYRGAEVINWMLQYRWMYSREEMAETLPGDEVSRYYFSAVKDIHRYFCFTLHHPGGSDCLGFLVFSASRRRGTTVLKILDHAFNCENAAWSACRRILLSAQKYLADRIDIPVDLIEYFESLKHFSPLIKKQVRTVFYHPKTDRSVLKNRMEQIHFNYCDGDGPFT